MVFGDHFFHEQVARIDTDTNFLHLAAVGQRVYRIIQNGKTVDGAFIKEASVGGEHHFPPFAQKQGNAQLVFQGTDHLTQRRLGNDQRLCRPADALTLGNHAEITNMKKGHTSAPFRSDNNLL